MKTHSLFRSWSILGVRSLLNFAFLHIFALWAHIFHADLLKCTCMVLQVCVAQMCLWGLCSPELLFKSIICGSLTRGTCSAQSIFLHGPPAPTRHVQIDPHRQMGSICSGSPAMDHRHPAGRMQNHPRCLSECFFLFFGFFFLSSAILPLYALPSYSALAF